MEAVSGTSLTERRANGYMSYELDADINNLCVYMLDGIPVAWFIMRVARVVGGC
jgi:hypothetical protein